MQTDLEAPQVSLSLLAATNCSLFFSKLPAESASALNSQRDAFAYECRRVAMSRGGKVGQGRGRGLIQKRGEETIAVPFGVDSGKVLFASLIESATLGRSGRRGCAAVSHGFYRSLKEITSDVDSARASGATQTHHAARED